MAGDWTKMRNNLPNDHRVARISAQLKVPKLHVCGCLFALWKDADEQSRTGFMRGATPDTIDESVGLPGFAAALMDAAVDWLRQEEGGMRVPRWGDHNSKSAKRRSEETERKRRQREKLRNVGQRDKNGTGAGQKRDTPRQSREQRAAAESREESREEQSSNAAALAAAPDQASPRLCSLLRSLAVNGVRVFDPATAAAIASHPNCSELQITWARERMRAAMSRANKPDNPGGYLRRLIESHTPPAGWVERYQRRKLAEIRAGDQSVLKLAGGVA